MLAIVLTGGTLATHGALLRRAHGSQGSGFNAAGEATSSRLLIFRVAVAAAKLNPGWRWTDRAMHRHGKSPRDNKSSRTDRRSQIVCSVKQRLLSQTNRHPRQRSRQGVCGRFERMFSETVVG